RILPVPASTGFWLHDPTCPSEHAFSPEQLERLHAWQASVDKDTANIPAVLEDLLAIPLITAQEDEVTLVTLVIYDVDPAVLRKMAAEWLIELREKILQRFCRIRHIYIDPDTGLYNRRALTLLLAKDSYRKTLFLIAAVPGTRTLAGGFQKILQVNALLRTLIEEPLFYLGQGLFAAVRCIDQRNACLNFSHRLISRLKREGLRRYMSVFPPYLLRIHRRKYSIDANGSSQKQNDAARTASATRPSWSEKNNIPLPCPQPLLYGGCKKNGEDLINSGFSLSLLRTSRICRMGRRRPRRSRIST
ncbi:hypothetical protein VU11_02680, partial [Desulfobulbus sp. US2]|nr:hypothetical protein [Desulfobulbus sp. US2]